MKELTTVDYVCKIIATLDGVSGPVPASELVRSLGGSGSYVPKVLSRMAGSGLLKSGVAGYELTRPASQITLADVLSVSGRQATPEHAGKVIDKLLEMADTVPITQVL